MKYCEFYILIGYVADFTQLAYSQFHLNFVTGHFYDGACTLSVIEESNGSQLTLCEWKFKLTNQKKKVHFSANEDVLNNENINKQVRV